MAGRGHCLYAKSIRQRDNGKFSRKRSDCRGCGCSLPGGVHSDVAGNSGKKLLGMRVVDWGGREASTGQILAREIMYVVLPVIPFVGLVHAFMVWFSSDHRGLFDRMADTCVV